jgi:uncharacterized protein
VDDPQGEGSGAVAVPEAAGEEPPAAASAPAPAAPAPAAPAPPVPASAVPASAVPTPPRIADGVLRALDPRSVALERLTGWISAGIFALVLLFALVLVVFLAPLPGWAKAGLALLWAIGSLTLAWFAHAWPAVAHRHASYKVDAEGIEIRRGVAWRKVINVPRSRVQHTDVSQGPLERGYGLGTLSVYTAGTDHARVDLGGLHHATALAIRDHLLPREGGDAV